MQDSALPRVVLLGSAQIARVPIKVMAGVPLRSPAHGLPSPAVGIYAVGYRADGRSLPAETSTDLDVYDISEIEKKNSCTGTCA